MKFKRKLVVFLVLLGMTVIFFAGRFYWKDYQKHKEISLIYIPKVVDGTNDFWTSLISGARMAAKEYGVQIEIAAPDKEQDVERQNELLKEAIEKEPDALLVSPSSFTKSTEILKTAKENDIPIVFIDSYINEDLQSLTVATDNLEVGKKLGEYAATLIEDETEIAIVGHVQGVSTAVEREKGLREGLGTKAENIKEVVFCNSMYDKAYELTMELVEKYPELGLIVGLNEYSSVGAARAVKELGAEGVIKVVGVDSSQEAIQMMEQGIFQGIVVQKAFKMGYVGVRETIKMLQGEDVSVSVDSGCELVTPENMYTSEIEKLIFPFEAAKK